MPTRRRLRPHPLLLGAILLLAVEISLVSAPGLRGLLGAALAAIMLGIAASDARRFSIPDYFTAAAFGLGCVHAAATGYVASDALLYALLRAAIVGLGLLAVMRLYRALRGREGLGLGDVKLAAVAGVWLDWPMLAAAIELATLSAIAVYALVSWRDGRQMVATAMLPFGVFLAPAIWLGWLAETLFARIWLA